MLALTVTVDIPGERRTTYRFNEPVIRVGRSATCELAILHRAMPRELCLAFIEQGGRAVRVEERPGLTNALCHRGNTVVGGVSGKAVAVSVGPIQLCFFPECAAYDDAPPAHPVTRRRSVLFAAGLLALTLAALSFSSAKTRHATASTLELPTTPWCEVDVEPCTDQPRCEEQGRLLLTRGRELLSANHDDPARRNEARGLLSRATWELSAAGSTAATAAQRELSALEAELQNRYSQEAALLGQALAAEQPNEIAAHARALAQRLDPVRRSPARRVADPRNTRSNAMTNLVLNRRAVLLYAALCTACAHTSHDAPAKRTPGGPAYEEALQTANALAAAGSHLEASLYYEAALSCGAQAELVLPRLLGALIRAGRLVAAREALTQLAAIEPEHPGLAELRATLDTVLAQHSVAAVKEESP